MARSSRSFPRRLVAGKAPWQTARCACRLARCACRSSSQKVLRYFLGALFARARSLRGKPCIEPCSERLLLSIQDPSTDARDDREGVKIFFKSSKILHFTFIICFVPHTAVLRCPFPLFRHFVTPSPRGEGKGRGAGASYRRATLPFSPLSSLRDTFPLGGRQGWGSGRLIPPRYAALLPSFVTS